MVDRVDRVDIKARAIECRAYVEASAAILERLPQGNGALDEIKRLLHRAKMALDELDEILDGVGNGK